MLAGQVHRDDDVEKLKLSALGTILLVILKYEKRSDLSRLISKVCREMLIGLQALFQRTSDIVNARKKIFCFRS